MTRRNGNIPAQPFGVTKQAGVKTDMGSALQQYHESRNRGKQPQMPGGVGNATGSRRSGSLGPVDERDGDFDPPGLENEQIDLNDDFSDLDFAPPPSVRQQLQQRGVQHTPLPAPQRQIAMPQQKQQVKLVLKKKAAPVQSKLDYVQQAISFLDTARLPLDYKIILENGTVDGKPVVYVIARHEGENGVAAEDRIATLYSPNDPRIQYRLDDLADYWASSLDTLLDMPYDMVDLERAVIKERDKHQSTMTAISFLADPIYDIATATMTEAQKEDFDHAWSTFAALLNNPVKDK